MIKLSNQKPNQQDSIACVMISLLAYSVVNCGLITGRIKPKTKLLCYSANHTTLSCKHKDCLARNKANVLESSDYSRIVVSAR